MLDALAQEQWDATQKYSPNLSRELAGIRDGAGVSTTEIVILNNYTDFRDIELPEEGCSTVSVHREGKHLAGQTWDMHGSAKEYLCLLWLSDRLIYTLVGCVGLMGYSADRRMIGVNNINTTNARAALLWPVLVRHVLEQNSFEKMRETLITAPVTSGHNYLIAEQRLAEMWEITPMQQECVSRFPGDSNLVHTNHCLGNRVKSEEIRSALSSTTHERMRLLSKKIESVIDLPTLVELLMDHEEFPRSICSHFQANGRDPSMTCGGAAADLNGARVVFWRGCSTRDKKFRAHGFRFTSTGFEHMDSLEGAQEPQAVGRGDV